VKKIVGIVGIVALFLVGVEFFGINTMIEFVLFLFVATFAIFAVLAAEGERRQSRVYEIEDLIFNIRSKIILESKDSAYNLICNEAETKLKTIKKQIAKGALDEKSDKDLRETKKELSDIWRNLN